MQSFLQWLLEYPAFKQFIQAQLQTTKKVTGFRHCMCFIKNQISSKVTRKICLRGTSRQVPGYSGKLSRCNSVSSFSAQQNPAGDVHTYSQDRADTMAGTPWVFLQHLRDHWVWFYLQEAPLHRAFPKLKALKTVVGCRDKFTKV